MNKIMICSNDYKKKLLLREESSFNHMKFYSKHEYLSHYYFDYDEKAIYYLMKNYHISYSIAKEYLSYLYVIEEKSYKSDKLNFLKEIKQELLEKQLLTLSPVFHAYIKDKEIDASTIYDLDLYEEEAMKTKVEVPEVKLDVPVYEFNSIEDEIHFVCIKIRELRKMGIPLSKIFLCNVSEEYYFLLEKMFSYYKIPIEIPFSNSIFSTPIVQKYLRTGELDLEKEDYVTKSICHLLGNVVDLEDDEIKKEIIIEECKNIMLPNPKYKEAVTIKDIKKSTFDKDEYVFVLGFNQDALPKIYKDTNFISDLEKEEVALYQTSYLNRREKKIIAYLLSKIEHLVMSYKLSSPFEKYYPSSMIGDYQLEVRKEELLDTEYSNEYNQIRLGEMLDDYYTYGNKHRLLDTLNGYYDSSYATYNHEFSGINQDTYLKELKYPLRLSYTSFNSYNECKFKYYINYVLRLGDYEETFAALIGSMYHHILTLYKKNNFDLETEWNKYLEKKELSLKDTVLLVRIRSDLEKLISVLKHQQQYTAFDTEYYEKECVVKIRDDISVEFMGYIDKIMTYQNISDTYFSIVDYKTGYIDIHIEPMKYGLHMQLPIYLYLIEKSKLFDSPIFTGIYYQNILFSYPTWSKKLESETKDNYKLKGYSTDNIENLERFDSTYKDSEIIKSMKYHDKFDYHSKVLSDDMIYKLTEYTDKMIHKTTDSILKADFQINPKIYNKENISCEYCQYRELCFVKENDQVYLPKVEDFAFLGGDE